MGVLRIGEYLRECCKGQKGVDLDVATLQRCVIQLSLKVSDNVGRHNTTPHNTTPRHSTPRHTTPYHTTPHHTTPHHTTPHHTTPHHTTPHHTTPHHTIPHHTTPHQTCHSTLATCWSTWTRRGPTTSTTSAS